MRATPTKRPWERVVVALWSVAALVSCSGSDSASDTSNSEALEVTATPPPTFAPGIVWLVGSDVLPGVLITVIPASSSRCYWQRLSRVSDDLDDLIEGDYYKEPPPGLQVIVEIAATDVAFETEGCGLWVEYVPPATPPATTFGDGTWMVGEHIAPGRYRSNGPAEGDNCYWERMSGLSGGLDHVLESYYEPRSAIVDILPGDVAFQSKGCGTWSLA